jgi:hypothetical protein
MNVVVHQKNKACGGGHSGIYGNGNSFLGRRFKKHGHEMNFSIEAFKNVTA